MVLRIKDIFHKNTKTGEEKPSAGTTLILESLGRQFEGFPPLFEGLNFTFTPGVYVFSGESGAGKTTLSRCIAGLDTAHTGKVILDGTPVTGTSSRIHVTGQSYFNYPWLNEEENVLMVCRAHKIRVTKGLRERARDILKRAGIYDEHKKPYELSGGQNQRLSLCRALFNEWSRVFIYDEPFSALDDDNDLLFAKMIQEHQKKYNTIEIIITHEMAPVKDIPRKDVRFIRDDESGTTNIIMDEIQIAGTSSGPANRKGDVGKNAPPKNKDEDNTGEHIDHRNICNRPYINRGYRAAPCSSRVRGRCSRPRSGHRHT